MCGIHLNLTPASPTDRSNHILLKPTVPSCLTDDPKTHHFFASMSINHFKFHVATPQKKMDPGEFFDKNWNKKIQGRRTSVQCIAGPRHLWGPVGLFVVDHRGVESIEFPGSLNRW